MTYNTIEDASLPSSSLHGADPENDTFEDLNEGLSLHDSVDLKRAAFGQRTQKDISMDLNDLLQEMEEERDESPCSDSSGSSNSASLALDVDEEADFIETSERMGSKLEIDELPSQSSGMDWGSLNWGSFMGSFRKRGNGSSRRLLRGLGSSKKLKTDAEGSTPTKKRRKSVRFFKFETILPSQESFRRRYSTEETRNREDLDRSFATY